MSKNNNGNGQMDKARLGSIGENLVVARLMEQGWDAFNANCNIKNYKSIDVVCLNSDIPESKEQAWKPKSALIQVKTSYGNNIPSGFTIEESLDKDYLEKNVKGPYVFVKVDKTDKGNVYNYYVLSRALFIELLHKAHVYYDNKHKGQESKTAPAGISISWLKGEKDFSTRDKNDFGNPITQPCEDEWDNIWK